MNPLFILYCFSSIIREEGGRISVDLNRYSEMDNMNDFMLYIRAHDIQLIGAVLLLILFLAAAGLWHSIAVGRRLDRIAERVEDYLDYLEEAETIDREEPVLADATGVHMAASPVNVRESSISDREEEKATALIDGVLEEIFP